MSSVAIPIALWGNVDEEADNNRLQESAGGRLPSSRSSPDRNLGYLRFQRTKHHRSNIVLDCFVLVSAPFKKIYVFQHDGEKMDYQEGLSEMARTRLNVYNAVIDKAGSDFAKTNNDNWNAAWLATVWNVLQNVNVPGEVTLILVNGGGDGCKKERQEIPRLIEDLQVCCIITFFIFILFLGGGGGEVVV